MSIPGFYGKLAGRGDFVHRGLSPAFIEAWDAWLSAGMAASRGELGDAWLDAYLVSPLWRFAVAPGLLGAEAVTGVMMPSIDRVGRYFPLTVALPLPAQVNLGALVSGAEDWFERTETLLLSTLEDQARFEQFEEAVQGLGLPAMVDGVPVQDTLTGAQCWWRVDTPQARGDALMHLVSGGCSLWWGCGSERVPPGLIRFQGMPPAQAFSRLLIEHAPAPGMAVE